LLDTGSCAKLLWTRPWSPTW